ncbi:hypothetical protein CXB51_015017 [Gossypium anomalum]|uniref:Retrotransposon gag domain-containing protein n=1 Tax=Gossypium anomalum TaxID=47600 RepID=A0A8J6D354_9ROSI|nr:hypothetical protein CXB51_015017 [Gossypium anomalum]
MAENQDNPLPLAIPAESANQNPAPRTMYDYAKPNFTGTQSSIDENPNTQLANFLELCDTFKINGVSNDAIHLWLFPFSLRNKAKQWLNSLPRGSITTWEQMTKKFLLKYFPPEKTAKLRNDISSFVQMDLETLYDAWERFKDLLRRCPHHGLPLWLQVQTFYNDVNPSTRQMIDAAAGGTINNKTPEEASEFIEEMSLNNYQWQVMRTKPTRIAGVYNVYPVMRCNSSGGGLPTEYPPFNPTTEKEQVNYIGNNNFRSQNNPYSNTYNAGWKNHPNFSWSGQGNQRPQNPQGFQQPPYQQEKKPNLEEMLSKFISILPSNTEPNPRKQLNAIDAQEGCVETEPEPRQENVKSKGDGGASHNKMVNVEYEPRVPYPNATRKNRSDEQFGKFLKLLKKLHINLLFIEALSQMPNAMKFLKELLANKRKLDEASHVELNAVCSAILQNKLPNKLKDPGSFTIPCLIGSLDVNNALADLGASINVMPYKMFKQLGLGKPKQTRMSIQLADKTIRFPRGIIEDVLVRVDKFIFPIDFVVLDIEEETNTPLILGRPFLATAKTIIDVGTGELTLRRLILIEVHQPCFNNTRRPIHEERRLQIEELDKWRVHKPRTPDKLKLRQNKLDTSPHQLKVRDQVLLDAVNPYIVTLKPDEETPLTVLSIFPFGTVEGRGRTYQKNMGVRHVLALRPWSRREASTGVRHTRA